MLKIIQRSLLLSTLFLGAQVNAQEVSSAHERNWSVGIGSYAFVVVDDQDNNDDDINFSGFNLAAAYAFNNHFQVRATYFSLENNDYNNVDSEGYDLMAYGGVGFSQKGFRGYGGAGFFSDKWSFDNQNDTFSGFQLGGGLGYNWGPVGFLFILNTICNSVGLGFELS